MNLFFITKSEETMRIFVAGMALMLALAVAGENAQAQGKAEQKRSAKKASSDASGKGWLGVSIQDVTPRLARERNLKTKTGALVSDVMEESPAEKAGLKEDDVIVEFQGKAIEDAGELTDAVRATAPETAASVTLYRGEEKKTLTVTVGKNRSRSYAYSYTIPPVPHIRVPAPRIPRIQMFMSDELFGLSLTDLKGQLGEYFGAPDGRGVLVQEVERKSAADNAGFKAGDVIVKVGTDQVETTRDIMEAVEEVKEGAKVEFGVIRKGSPATLTVEADELPHSRLERLHHELDDHGRSEFHRGEFQKQMEMLKRELKSAGQSLRLRMDHLRETLRRELRNVIS
jgi:C-terminal processing protease CtpA/Prc